MKKQLKKSLSLFMAVLMLMSCWVWIAPTEASAATNYDYPVEIGWTVQDTTSLTAYVELIVKYVDYNGTGTMNQQTYTCSDSSYFNTDGDKRWSITVPGFPVVFMMRFGVDSNISNNNESKILWNYVKIGSGENIVGYQDSLKYTFTRGSATAGGYGDRKTFYHADYSSYADGDDNASVNYEKPMPIRFTNPTTSAINITLNPIGGADVEGTGSWSGGTYFDQYGIQWGVDDNAANFSKSTRVSSYIAAAAGATSATLYEHDGVNTLTYVSSDTYGSSITGGVKVKANAKAALQIANSNSSGKLTAYLVENYKYTYTYASGTVKEYDSIVSVPINITYPTYTVSFDGDGVTPQSNPAQIELKEGNTVSTVASAYSVANYYGQNIAKYPTGNATKTGHSFYGFWTEPQPSDSAEKASPYIAEADFAVPASSEDFANYESSGGTVNGKYVTYNGVTYYNAGTKWDPSNRVVEKTVTYYGWWLADDVTVKFYDVDGAYLDTVNTKYGKTQSDITWPDPTESYENGAYSYANFANKWTTPGGEIIDETAHTFTKDLVLTPKYNTIAYNGTYSVSFINPSNGSALNIGASSFSYRDNLTNAGGVNYVQNATNLVSVPVLISYDDDYSYVFEGWTTVAPASGSYHIMIEEGGFDADGHALPINADWIVRDNTTYYPVFRRQARSYVISFSYIDGTGAQATQQTTINYGEKLTAPVDAVPYEYAKEGYGYTFKAWNYTNADKATSSFDYNGSVIFNNENFNLPTDAWNDGENVTPITIQATYGDGVPTPYTVTFNYRDASGAAATKTVQVNHGNKITQETVDQLIAAVPEFADDGEVVYRYTGMWDYNGTDYNISELTSYSPTSHVIFNAEYEASNEYYDVTYIDGSRTATFKVLGGETLPAFTYKGINDAGTPDDTSDDYEEDVEYIPDDYETAQGVYEFQGWYDEEQKDETFAATNGTKYTAESVINSDVTLYAQYKFIPTTYEFYFMDHTGEVQLGAAKLEYGQDLSMYEVLATKAAQGRAADETYTYEFIGWDKEVPTYCEGRSMTFVAQYKATYNYYDVQWYNSKLVDGEWVIDETEETLLAETHHTYKGKIYAPSVAVVCPETAPAGQNYVTTGWYYVDADGNEQQYTRGMLMNSTDGYKMYPKYELTAAIRTVTTVVDGEETAYEIANGNKADMIMDPASGWSNEDEHREFAGWYTDEACTDGNEFDIANTAITADVKIYAKFNTELHSFDKTEVLTYPTYYAEGTLNTWCECDKNQTQKTSVIDVLSDSVIPTGTMYIGTQWKTGDAIDDDAEPTIYVNDDTDIIITVNDTGDVDSAYNPLGQGKGIATIKGFISNGVYTPENADSVNISEVKTLYSDDSEALNNTVNVVIDIGEYEGLVEGETYVAYFNVTDKAGNVLNRNVRSAKFIYDTTAPAFTVEGDSNADRVSGTPTYCKQAIITGIEEGTILTINGKQVEASWAEGATEGEYNIVDAGNYLVTVTDKAGNKTSKKLVVAADHNTVIKEVKSTCETDGYKTEICSICTKIQSEVKYPTSGHVWTQSVITATCTENGYIYNICSVCGEEQKIETDDNGEVLYPAAGHGYEEDAEGQVIYTQVTAPTCIEPGKEAAKCLYCDHVEYRAVAADTVNGHKYGAVKTVKATCTSDGYKYQNCKYCYQQNITETLTATGHTYDAANDDHYVVTQKATCGTAGTEVLQCQVCNTYITDEAGSNITREIPATGRHIYYVSEDPSETYDATVDADGQITRYCENCDGKWVETVTKIESYTVIFNADDGTEIAKFEKVIKGTTIDTDDVASPEKDDSADGKTRYTFKCWVDAEGNEYDLPLDVSADLTLTASYTESSIIYIHKFVVPTTYGNDVVAADGEAEAAPQFGNFTEMTSLMGAMGDSRVPEAKPTLKATELYTFEFLGWSTKENSEANIVTDFTVAGDATFYAVFKPVPVAYEVIFYNGTTFLYKTTVNGGETAVYGGEEPTKAFDDTYHYEFSGWDKALTNITATTRVYAKFNGIAHSHDKTNGVVTQEATCVLPELTTYTCSCGHELVEQSDKALGHSMSEYVYDEETGYNVSTCSRCGHTDSIKASFTVKFENENGTRLATYTVKNAGSVTYDFTKYAAPTKAATAQYEYTFAGWVDAAGNTYAKDYTFANVTADATYTAYYTEAVRYYQVSYVTSANKVLQTALLAYGDTVPAYAGSTDKATIPVPAFTNAAHYVFDKWDVEAGTTVTKELVIKPVFKTEAHTEVESSSTDATCTQAGGKGVTCSADCGYAYTDGAIPALGHKFTVTRVEPDYEKGIDGYVTYICQRETCDHADDYTVTLSAKLIDVTVTVKDSNGNPRQGVAVSLVYADQPSKAVDGTYTLTTGADGKVTFQVKPGNYMAKIGDNFYDITVDSDRNVSGGDITEAPEQVVTPSCSCSCHRSGFWGIIFRFFHKIIAFFTGRINCCECPDPAYN